MGDCKDLKEEESLLQLTGIKMGVLVDCMRKCHCELADVGIEYSWGCCHLPLWEKNERQFQVLESRCSNKNVNLPVLKKILLVHADISCITASKGDNKQLQKCITQWAYGHNSQDQMILNALLCNWLWSRLHYFHCCAEARWQTSYIRFIYFIILFLFYLCCHCLMLLLMKKLFCLWWRSAIFEYVPQYMWVACKRRKKYPLTTLTWF